MKANVSRAPRRVWRMTAENQLGEVLELTPAAAAAATGHPHRAEPRTLKPASAPSWRSSSYDLLHGLRVHDISDKIPARMFDALFSPDPAAGPVSGKTGS